MRKIVIIIAAATAFVIGACSVDKNILSEDQRVYTVISNACIGCSDCVQICPYGAIDMVDNIAVIDPTKCVGCSDCSKVCPADAIE